MKILLLHNYYQQPGGEDAVFANEGLLLEQRGHTVLRFHQHNDEVREMSALRAAGATLWNGSVYRQVRSLIRENRVDICHFHNTFPLISPAAYYAARDESVPVIQTLHNYRLICPKAVLYRNGAVCERCVGSLPWRGVWHACYRGSRTATAVTAAMLAAHRIAGTWAKVVDAYIALTSFCRDKFVEAGLPADRIVVKPNFLASDPGIGLGRGGYAMFAGRLTEEKGLRTLLNAWERVAAPVRLKIAGGGPLEEEVSRAAARDPRIEFLGAVSPDQVRRLLADAAFLVFPSVWYEAGPMTIIEAFACGTPVIASALGSTAAIVADGRTGVHFPPGDARALAATIEAVWSSPDKLAAMRSAARAAFEAEFTAERNYTQLMAVYHRAAGAASAAAEAA